MAEPPAGRTELTGVFFFFAQQKTPPGGEWGRRPGRVFWALGNVLIDGANAPMDVGQVGYARF